MMAGEVAPGRGPREPFSCWSHAMGAVLAVVGTGVLVALAEGRLWHLVSYLIYGASLITLYTASALYHGFRRENPWLQRFDHMAIYLVIAGSYVPICLIALRGPLGFGFLAAQAVLATIGIVANLRWGGGPKWLRLVLYLTMGWMAVFALEPLRAVVPASALGWLLAGGLFYSVGTVVYATKRPRLWPGRFGAHDLWHLFVLAGSASHYLMVLELTRLP